ncbi:BrnA antitoxin family protein [Cupriavidus sp. MP-37]|uniref:BrnA antitoxin family protein n=1 Tax=Cupriavidus sp. MP-37 TaxID=2884455 RepID=UPI001D0AEF6D|nr:BrnA antitoxin family protein [Cupriavidus sp. MP-37]UDM51120.1 BrnA antitoxin family protein [Cupriavidus sp. MP-37]
MNGNKRATSTTWVDPDDAPELTDEFFKQADLLHGDKLVKRGRGRPRGTTKTATTVRLDDDVLEALKASGPRWQTRLNVLVRDWLKTHKLDEIEV